LVIEKEIVENNNQNYIDLIVKKIKPFVLRRKKEDVAKDLPDKIILQQWCELTDEQKYYYNKIIEEKDKLLELDSFNLLKILEKLKQLCIHPALVNYKMDPILGRSEKFDLAYELIMEIIEKNEKCIIFSEYLNPLNFIEELLILNGIKYIKITGAVQNRQELIDLFNNDENYKVAILSLRATSHGITLTSSNNAILLDLWWNPAVINQAIDRIHRIGQQRTVYVHQI
jgi:SNF2 family DNA or RNA helicase